MRDMLRVLIVLLAAFVAGCNPYVAAVSVVSQTYGAATDDRSLSTQASDEEIKAKIKASLLASPVSGTSGIDVFCQRGVVVLAGVVPPGSQAGSAGARIARETSGVRRVETFFVASESSRVGDFETKAKINAAFVADSSIDESQVSVGVYSGHVVLVGVVSGPEVAEEFVADASSVPGVQSVRSYIQVK